MLPEGKTKVTGRAFAPGSSELIEAELVCRPNSPELFLLNSADRSILTRSPRAQAELGSVVGSGPVNVTLSGGWLFQTEDHDVTALMDESFSSRTLRSWEAVRPRLLIAVAATAFCVWLLWKYGLDILASLAVAATPPGLTSAMDVATMQTIDTTLADETQLSAPLQAKVQTIFKTLVDALPPEEQPGFTLQFRKFPESLGPNAFALPGGTLVMTDALVDQFQEDPDALAGVLGHEIGHKVEAHGLRQLYRSLSVYFLVALIAGDTGPILEDFLFEGQLLLQLSHSRAHERSADDFGLALMRNAGYDPKGLKRFFATLEDLAPDSETDSEWLSTHPLNKDRIDRIDAFIEENRY